MATEKQRSSESSTESNNERVEMKNENCPECGGNIQDDESQGETYCQECGFVLEEDNIDYGPEWRAFNHKERQEKTRVGSPESEMIHDKGLSTNIGGTNKDAYGRELSSRKKAQIKRLRTWNKRFKTSDSKERNLKQALGEIDRMASALGIPDNVRETASVIYKRCLSDDLLPGRSIEGVATASLYTSSRQCSQPRSLSEMESVSRVEQEEISKTYRYISRELGLEMEPQDPKSYIPRFASELGLPSETELKAKELVDNATKNGNFSGKSPVGLAAASIYASALLTDKDVTQNEVSGVAQVSEVTIRNRYTEILENQK